jgi:hypothetical protein
MLEIIKSNSKTSNNNASLAVTMLTINITRLAAITLAVFIIATPLKLTTFIVLIIAAPFKRNTYKVIRGCAASSAS